MSTLPPLVIGSGRTNHAIWFESRGVSERRTQPRTTNLRSRSSANGTEIARCEVLIFQLPVRSVGSPFLDLVVLNEHEHRFV